MVQLLFCNNKWERVGICMYIYIYTHISLYSPEVPLYIYIYIYMQGLTGVYSGSPVEARLSEPKKLAGL